MTNRGSRVLVALLTTFALSLGIGLYTGVLLPRARPTVPLPGFEHQVMTSIKESLQDELSTLVGSLELTTPSLQDSLQAVLGTEDAEKASRLAAIERTLQRAFPALPKNAHGRVGPQAVRYLVQRHFSELDGWRIKGLEPSSQGIRIRTMGQPGGMRLGHVRTSDREVQQLSFLHQKAPKLVRALEKTQEAGAGFSVGDAAAVIMALENLIYVDSLEYLQAAYKVNHALPSKPLGAAQAYDVALSYFLLFDSGERLSDENVTYALRGLKAMQAREPTGLGAGIIRFARDTILSYHTEHSQGQSSSEQVLFSYKNMSHIAEHMMHGYGKFQNQECRSMKKDLMSISDPGTGRVPLDRFYAAPQGPTYTFAEKPDELRDMGALDESLGGSLPMVVLANYLLAPSNCLLTKSYYSVCCLNECEYLMAEIEAQVRSPSVDPNHLLAVVANLSSDSVEAPRSLPESLTAKLPGIAAHHRGEVPLHSRLFAQWMHFAFPNECPYPQVYRASNPAAPLHPEDFQWPSFEQLEIDKAQFLARARKAKNETSGSTPHLSQHSKPPLNPVLSQWTEDEVMLLQETDAHGELGYIICLLMQVMSLVVVLKMAMSIWQTGRHKHGKVVQTIAVDVAEEGSVEIQADSF